MKRTLILNDADTMVDVATVSMSGLHAVADHCKMQRDTGDTGDKDMKLLAHVPGILIEKYCLDNGIQFSEFMRNPAIATRMLNDPVMKTFRVYEGKV